MSAVVARPIRVRIFVFFLLAFALGIVGCSRDASDRGFGDVSAEAQKAIAGSVDFLLTEDIFQRWERAQANLEKLPRRELDKTPDPGGTDPVDRGIRRLESSLLARRAIETSGLSVKEFVLATVALAQAVKATQAGVPPTIGPIAANVRFVIAHSSRLSNRGAAGVWVPPAELSVEEIEYHRAMAAESASAAGEPEQGQAVELQVQDQPRTLNENLPTRDSGSSAPSNSQDRPKTDSLPSGN